MAESKKNKFGGIVVGPIVVVMSISVLWKNEGRFDYHKAAQATPGQFDASMISDDSAPPLQKQLFKPFVHGV